MGTPQPLELYARRKIIREVKGLSKSRYSLKNE